MQNISIFLVSFKAKCSIFWRFIKNLPNDNQITEKKTQKPRLLIVLISQIRSNKVCISMLYGLYLNVITF